MKSLLKSKWFWGITIFIGLMSLYQFIGRKKALVNIDKIVEANVASHIKIAKEKCFASLVEKADEVVDSLLFADAVLRTNDSVYWQNKPLKPEKPELIKIPDSIKLKPIFPINKK
jgi:hypothetical protein